MKVKRISDARKAELFVDEFFSGLHRQLGISPVEFLLDYVMATRSCLDRGLLFPADDSEQDPESIIIALCPGEGQNRQLWESKKVMEAAEDQRPGPGDATSTPLPDMIQRKRDRDRH